MVLYEDTTLEYDYTEYEKNFIGIGGTCTIKTETETIDMIQAAIIYNTKRIIGKPAAELEDFDEWDIKDVSYNLEDIKEIIIEGFYINRNNRANIVKLLHDENLTITKIPRRE